MYGNPNTSLAHGSPASLTCSSKCPTKFKVYKGSKDVTNWSHKNLDFNFKINSFDSDDQGEYMCKVGEPARSSAVSEKLVLTLGK